MSAAIADVDSELHQRCPEGALEQRAHNTDLGKAHRDNRQAGEEGVWIVRPVPCDLLGLERTDLTFVVDIPKARCGRCGDRRWTMGGDEDLRSTVLELIDSTPCR
jgi:hypothetical protein